MHYAHSTKRADRSDWQRLLDHLNAVARLAAELGNKFGAGRAAALAGLLHDLGKYAQAFQIYIGGHGPSVDHATAGAQQVLKLPIEGRDRAIADLLTYAIAGHHGGLPDRSAETGSLDERLEKKLSPLDPVWRNELILDATKLAPTHFRPHPDPARVPFQLAFLGRMLFSCLVDADFLDTESFYAEREGRQVDRHWPRLRDCISNLIAALDTHMADKQHKAPATPVNRLRAEILSHVRGKATLERGLFTLNVPTGGGKTLTSLAFALDHARHWRMHRIIYAIPFTSVIDQTAAIFRNVLGSDIVLEHHCALEPATADAEDRFRNGDREAKLRLAMENWQAPVVVTTNVQLLESLFANRPSRCRKLHNLANAVIVLDEAQTIPHHVLRPSVAALDELARNYGCTIVLCTATQPALAAPGFGGGFTISPERELAPDPARLHRALARTTQRLRGPMTDDELIAEIADTDQALVIVNSRRHALTLYRAAKEHGIAALLHLSTRQAAIDRRPLLDAIRSRLRDKQPCRVIATSLVEAGVDLDFPRVWRAEAGLDQITQAAGRCNREGGRQPDDSIVTIFQPAQARAPSEIAGLIGDTRRILAEHHGDLFTPEAIAAYFREVYWRKGDAGLDRIMVPNADGLITPVQTLQQFAVSSGRSSFAYRRVGDGFRLIQNGMQPVIVPRDEDTERTLAALRNGLPPATAARRLQPYIVQVPPRDHARLIRNEQVQYVDDLGDQFPVLTAMRLYTPEVGLMWEDADTLGIDEWLI
ncbi:CRISPR-associated helicase Cas3' [Bradyrhizobium sp. U87765 SZCCT0131]|uniref:CRISPR-associated helicase Cas3' n=1 Tax=unclassified Bradyrhizobium TaxID=2631580 RepID=UPI001BABE54D|nr:MULTISPECIES: CRISPR-associated helicase Cas3' [unclassified Bradyrhizobium]MBR1217945.1 CRISPR-associated helicase Cas3' [Bradyrhizobium sp. U87765 SZCCT0131]MBR1261109.1 CRISPR-associated helicase Cas3' [Bradyrhizobium sp. U87765 SZCCT0134]MBR1303443.1 CRISPR-associated helicase Cas3' [Bradyrhizobium sp. U87765 SZCCT0110]MBR1319049.1 CRISPR-associated helicase Cas3' [Bradyrhizobium sp. U87765 SZCCT0109]MBR1347374.1 CRISPR-associated helicase Cas3' [Bradyrhizobium sp. U87765 SZCCT0048]